MRGALDQALTRVVDALVSIPLFVFSLLLIVGLGVGHTQAILAIGLGAAPRFFRVIRSSALAVSGREFVLGARARGESAFYIQYGEMLPNLWAPIIVEASIFVGFALMGGTALSYLELGTQPPAADWGVIVREAQRFDLAILVAACRPSLATAAAIISFNLFGEGLGDALPARSKQGA